ncbi:MAG TPA: ABC transporter permease [Vicinamibacterales bacterium]|nr:ABC transporter permease [Vicinamibacterales bacterium]
MTRVGLVAWHVFKESVRDRVLFAIAGFALLLVAASVLIGQITAGQDVKIIKDIGLATLELAGVLMAVFIGVGLVSREIERKSVYSLLAKPVHRWEFVLGKYLGLVGTIAVNVLLMTVALFVVLAWLERKVPDPVLLKAVVLILGELALLTAVALFFSTFSSSGILSAGLTLGVWVVGLFSEDLRGFSAVVNSRVLASTVRTVGLMVPAFSAFDIKAEVVSGRPPVLWSYVAMTLAYAACYAGALVGASMAIFSRREFK